MKWVVLLVLVAALVVVLYMLFVKPKKRKLEGHVIEDAGDISPLDARRGDTVTVVAMGEQYDDLLFTVASVSRYESGGDRWPELSGDYRGRTVYLEAWHDDGLHVLVTRPWEEASMADVGLGEPDLIRLDEGQDTTTEIDALGVRWRFTGSEEVLYYEDGRGGGDGCYAWSFDEIDGPRTLTIEKWEGEPFEAVVSHRVPPGDVQILRG